MTLILIVKTKMSKKNNSRFHYLYIGPNKLYTLYFNFQHLKDHMAVTFPAIFALKSLSRMVLD